MNIKMTTVALAAAFATTPLAAQEFGGEIALGYFHNLTDGFGQTVVEGALAARFGNGFVAQIDVAAMNYPSNNIGFTENTAYAAHLGYEVSEALTFGVFAHQENWVGNLYSSYGAEVIGSVDQFDFGLSFAQYQQNENDGDFSSGIVSAEVGYQISEELNIRAFGAYETDSDMAGYGIGGRYEIGDAVGSVGGLFIDAEVGLTGATADQAYVGMRIGKSFGAGKVFNNNKPWWSYFPAY